MNFFFNFIKFVVKFLSNFIILCFNFFVKFKEMLSYTFLVLLRFFFFLGFLLFDIFYKFLFHIYNFLIYYILYFYNYIVIRIKSLKLITIKFDTYSFNNFVKKYKIKTLYSYANIFINLYLLYFLKYFYLFFKKIFFFFFSKIYFIFLYFISFIEIIFIYLFTFLKFFFHFFFFSFSNLKYFLYSCLNYFLSFLKLKFPFLYKFFLFSRLGYFLAIFYIYFVIIFPLLQNYEDILFYYQFNNIGDTFFWYGNLFDTGSITSKGWFSNIYDAGDFFLIKIIISISYFLVFLSYFRNVWFKEEDWETTFIDSEFDNDEIMEEEDDFDEPYVEEDNIIQQGEEVTEYFDELRGKSLVKARIHNFTYSNGYLISNDYGWGFYITFWIFTFYYSIKMFFWPSFVFLPYASLFNLHAKSTMYGALIPFMENYLHSNFFVYNNWLPGSPLKHVWYHKNYNNINVSIAPEELFWNRPRNYNWTNWNEIYNNFSEKFYFKRKPRFGSLEGGQRRYALYNPLTNLGFLDYDDYIYQESFKDRKKHLDRFEPKKMYGIVDAWNEIYDSYPLVDKNLNFWKRSVLGSRGQLNSYYNNGYNFLNYFPTKESLFGIQFGLDIKNFFSKEVSSSFVNLNSKFTNFKNYDFSSVNSGLDFFYTHFIYKREIPSMSLSYDFADNGRRIKPLKESSFLLFPHASAPFYTTIARITILPYFRRITLPVSYDYGLSAGELDKNLPFWLFFNNSIIYNAKSSFLFFDLLNYFEKNYKDSFYRKLLLKLWFEYKEGKFGVGLLKNYVYPMYFFDMQHSPYNFKYNSIYSKISLSEQEHVLSENFNDLSYFYKTKFFNPLDPKWSYPLWFELASETHFDSIKFLGRDMPKKDIERNAVYGFIVKPNEYYHWKKDLTYFAYVTAFLFPKVWPIEISQNTLFRDIYFFPFKNYSSHFSYEEVNNAKAYPFDKNSSFIKNFFNGFNIELPTSKQTNFINYYNKYFSRREGNPSNLLNFQTSYFSSYRKRKEINLFSLFDSFFSLRTFDFMHSNVYLLENEYDDVDYSSLDGATYNFSDITKGLRQMPFLFFDDTRISSLKKNYLNSISPHSLAKENFINLHFVYLKHLNFDANQNFSQNFSKIVSSSDLFFDWYYDYFYYILGPTSESVANLPYQFVVDEIKGLLYKKEAVVILNKFTFLQAPYTSISMLLKVYTVSLNILMYILETIQSFISQIYVVDFSSIKKNIASFLNFIFLSFTDFSFLEEGFFYIYDDKLYKNHYNYQLLLELNSNNSDFFYNIDLKSFSAVESLSDFIIPYALRSLGSSKKLEVSDFFLLHRSLIFDFLYNSKEKTSFYVPLLKGFFLYDILFVLSKLNSTDMQNSFLFKIDSFNTLFLDLDLSEEIFYDLKFLNLIVYKNDFWIGDAQTSFFLTYDSRFLKIPFYNNNLFFMSGPYFKNSLLIDIPN